jgi:hypothetical protein
LVHRSLHLGTHLLLESQVIASKVLKTNAIFEFVIHRKVRSKARLARARGDVSWQVPQVMTQVSHIRGASLLSFGVSSGREQCLSFPDC